MRPDDGGITHLRNIVKNSTNYTQKTIIFKNVFHELSQLFQDNKVLIIIAVNLNAKLCTVTLEIPVKLTNSTHVLSCRRSLNENPKSVSLVR